MHASDATPFAMCPKHLGEVLLRYCSGGEVSEEEEEKEEEEEEQVVV